jgi:hypothetical protein
MSLVTSEIQPEWLKVRDAARLVSLSVPTIYNLVNEGLVKSVSLRRPGMIRGARLISVDSLRGYLSSLPSGAAGPQ